MFKNPLNKNAYLPKLILIWYILFECYRAVFILKYNVYLKGNSTIEIISMLWHGFRLDLSTIGYFLALPFLLSLGLLFIKRKQIFYRFHKLLFVINGFIALFYILICAGELGTYGEWEGKLSAKVFTHLVNPSEIFATASLSDTMSFTLFVVVFIGLFLILYNKIVFNTQEFVKMSRVKTAISFPFIAGLIFLMIRGGWQPIPIQLSNAYYSGNQFLNDVSVNSFWAFGNSLEKVKNRNNSNPFAMNAKDEAAAIITALFANEKDKAPIIIKKPKPNIAFIILESWSADMIKALNGYADITPNFDKLVGQGILFENFYGAGWTSDQAMSAMFSSAVVFPNYTIIHEPEIFRKLPVITDELHAFGYSSSYFFGGDLDYGNIKAYLLNKNFQKIKDEDSYDSEFPRGKLGVQDEYMFNQYIKEIGELKEPFFTNLFTVSSHSPYDFPGDHPLDWGGDQNDYINSVHYTDSCLGDFFEKAKQEKWYANTLFVVVADHSHVSPKKRRACDKDKVRVPLLLIGDVLKNEYVGSKVSKIGNHLDFPATLLYQLGIDHTSYRYSKNLLDTASNGFASFTFHNGFGWINEEGYFGYTFNTNKIVCSSNSSDPIVQQKVEKQGMSFFQLSFEHFY